jgi:hypothetical protein
MINNYILNIDNSHLFTKHLLNEFLLVDDSLIIDKFSQYENN